MEKMYYYKSINETLREYHEKANFFNVFYFELNFPLLSTHCINPSFDLDRCEKYAIINHIHHGFLFAGIC